MNRARALFCAAVLGLAGLFGLSVLAGCASDPGGERSGGAFNAIIGGQADSTPFYTTGPGEQVPDKYLPVHVKYNGSKPWTLLAPEGAGTTVELQRLAECFRSVYIKAKSKWSS